MKKTILQLEDKEAEALATLANRFGYRDAIELSKSPEEAALMMQSMNELQQQLNQ
mgnify:CR=1 FL=1